MDLKHAHAGAKRTVLILAAKILLALLMVMSFALLPMRLNAQEPLCIKAGSIWSSEELENYNNPRNFAYRFMGVNDDDTNCDMMARDCDRVVIWASFVYDNFFTPWTDRKGKRGIDLNSVACD